MSPYKPCSVESVVLYVLTMNILDSSHSFNPSTFFEGFSEFCLMFPYGFVLGKVSTADRHHNHGNSYKKQHFIVTDLQLHRVSQLSLWYEAWQHPGTHGPEEGLNVLHFDPKVARKRWVWITLARLKYICETTKHHLHSEIISLRRLYFL